MTADIVEEAFAALCIALGVVASACSFFCGAVVTGVCYASGYLAQEAINAAIDEAQDTLQEISDTAETPEISASSTNSAAPVDNEVNQENDYEATQGNGASDYPMDSGNTGQTNPGEDLSYVDGFDFTLFQVFFQFTNLWIIVSFIDLVIIYRRIIIVVSRIIELQQGRKIVENSEYFVENNVRTKWGERLVKFKKFFGFVGHLKNFLFKDLFPLIMFCIGFYLLVDTTEQFFAIDTVTNLGIYQFWTIPVIAQQTTTNSVLNNKQDTYNTQLLPQLASSMITNIQTIEETILAFNEEQNFNVSQYNDHKCGYQFEIASYIDIYYCFAKYYGTSASQNICSGCDQDIKAMCMAGGDFIAKEFAGKFFFYGFFLFLLLFGVQYNAPIFVKTDKKYLTLLFHR